MTELTDHQIKKALEQKVSKLTKQLELAQMALDAYKDVVYEDSKSTSLANNMLDKPITGKFIQQQLAYLEQENRLLGARTMYEAHQGRNPKYPSIFETFSSQLTTYSRGNSPKIKRFVVENAPNSKKYWYGLKEWFIGDDLREEYKAKLYEEFE